MREVDQALARVYAPSSRTDSADRRAPVPPGPHFPIAVEPTRLESNPNEVLLQWPETVRALERSHGERFDRLADALIAIRDQRMLKILLFTSCRRAEGRTTLVLSVARALARRPGRVLLVDADLTGPMLARQLGLVPKVGLDDVVDRDLALSEAILAAPDDHLSILPIRAPVASPKEFLSRPSWSCALARLRREYDLVLLDGSPLFVGLSAAVLHRSVDAAILVRRRELTGERSLVRAKEVLDAGGVPLLGIAETFV